MISMNNYVLNSLQVFSLETISNYISENFKTPSRTRKFFINHLNSIFYTSGLRQTGNDTSNLHEKRISWKTFLACSGVYQLMNPHSSLDSKIAIIEAVIGILAAECGIRGINNFYIGNKKRAVAQIAAGLGTSLLISATITDNMSFMDKLYSDTVERRQSVFFQSKVFRLLVCAEHCLLMISTYPLNLSNFLKFP